MIVTSILFIVLSYSAICQTTYSKVIHEQNYTGIQSNGTFRNDNGELIFSGNFEFGRSHVSKIDSTGNPVWTKTFNLSDQNGFFDHFIQKDQIIRLIDSNFLLTRNLVDWSSGKTLCYLIKFSESGTLLWSKRTHKNDASNTWSSFSLEMDNGKILHALTPAGSGKLDIVRLNSNGIIENQINLDIDNSAEPVAFVKDGMIGYLILKTSINSCFVVKIDSIGSIMETKKITDFVPVDGTMHNSSLFVIGQSTNGMQLTAKLDYSTDSVYFLNSTNGDQKRIKSINNELFIITNNFTFGTIINVDFTNAITKESSYNGSPINLYSVDAERFLSICNGPTYGIKQFGDPQVGIALFDSVGMGNSFCFSPPNVTTNLLSYSTLLSHDTLLSNTSPLSVADTLTVNWLDGNLFVGLGCVDNLGGVEEQTNEKSIVLVPNPSETHFSINSDKPINAVVKVLNFEGKEVKTANINGITLQIETENFESGIYLVRLILENGLMINKKLIIMH